MEYRKIKVTYPSHPKRLNRIIAVKGNPDLITLGLFIGRSLEADFDHFYLFTKGRISYIPDEWFHYGEQYDSEPISKYTLDDMGASFRFEYDTGEDYVFNCSVLKKVYHYQLKEYETEQEAPDAIILEGTGAGIFEDDHWTLDRYLNGEISGSISNDVQDDDIFMPHNLLLDKLSDFDLPYQPDEAELYKTEFDYILDHLFPGYGQGSYGLNENFDEDDQLEDDEFDDEEIMEDMFIAMVRSQAAYDIFNDEYVNHAYRDLLTRHDMNDAYEMIVNSLLMAISTLDGIEDIDDLDDDAVEEAFHSNLSKLN